MACASIGNQLDFHVGGVPVKFPCKPYRTQMSMMAKIIQALNKKENALLESPTGSGKSLALLCSTLAWVKHNSQAKECSCSCHTLSHGNTTCDTSSCGDSSEAACSSYKKEAPCQGHTALQAPPHCPTGVVGSSDSKMVHTATPLKTGSETESASHDQTTPVEEKKPDVKVPDALPQINISSSPDSNDFKEQKKKPKQKKRIRTKGVKYLDDEEVNRLATDSQLIPDEKGLPRWRMELKSTDASVGTERSDVAISVKTDGVEASVATQLPCPACHCVPDVNAMNRSGGHCGGVAKDGSVYGAAEESGAGNTINVVRSPYRIYFSSRTHKQITQLTHEMARTAYSSTLMSILASREHTCIHPVVSVNKNKNDECKKLLRSKHDMCRYHCKVQRKMGCQAQLLQNGLSTAWDIEDLVQLGKKLKACPYFATRTLKDEATIIFCPYNYLIDPLIREQMEIEVEGQIVVFDEGHNLEDVSREAASLTVTVPQLNTVIEECNDVIAELANLIAMCKDASKAMNSYKYLVAILQGLKGWMEATVLKLPSTGYELSYGIWTGSDFLPILKDVAIAPETYSFIQEHIRTISNPENRFSSDENELELPSISDSSIAVIKQLFIVIGFLFKDRMKYLDDYRISLMKNISIVMVDKSLLPSGFRRRRRNWVPERMPVVSLNFWCLNPAVAFSELNCARSVILTSGTLSPMHSFSSELGVNFSIQLEATHIIPEVQTWVHSISHGPNGRPLLANYQNSETFEFQDEIGNVILKVCQVVPCGVLCFFSSYKMLEKLTKRWQDTGLWDQITSHKTVLSEPRSGEKKELFEEAIFSFYQTVRESQYHQHEGGGDATVCGGAIFLAVCRGKISEGLDFSDNNARAVITVGIPFPNFKDKQVELKREYNNEHSRSRNLLSGGEWYEIQAYRALNQALGRCIRHKNDWGALILIDERFNRGYQYTKGLSKWVRQRMNHSATFQQAHESLANFVKQRQQVSMTTCTSEIHSPCRMNNSLSVSHNSSFLPNLSVSTLPDHPPLNPTIPSSAVHVNVPLSPAQASVTVANPNVGRLLGNLHATPLLTNQSLLDSVSLLLSARSGKFSPTATVGTAHNPVLGTSSKCSSMVVAAKEEAQLQCPPQHIQLQCPTQHGLLQYLPCQEAVPTVGTHSTEPVSATGESVSSLLSQAKAPMIQAKPFVVSSPLLFDSCASTSPNLQASSSPTNLAAPVPSPTSTSLPLTVTPLHTSPNTYSTAWIPVTSPISSVIHKLTSSSISLPLQNTSVTASSAKGNRSCVPSPPLDVAATTPLQSTPKRISIVQQHLHTPFQHVPSHHTTLLPPSDHFPDKQPSPVCSSAAMQTVFESEDVMMIDSDATPPLTPKKVSTPNPVKDTESLPRKRKRNYRITNKRYAPLDLNCDTDSKPLELVEANDDEDFKKVKLKTPQKKPSCSKIARSDAVCSSCRRAVTCKMTSSSVVDLKEALLASGDSQCSRRQQLGTCSLVRHLSLNGLSRKSLNVYLLPNQDLKGVVCKKDKSEYNAVWDEKLEMCYTLLECAGCEEFIGVRVLSAQHSSTNMDFMGKVILLPEKISLN